MPSRVTRAGLIVFSLAAWVLFLTLTLTRIGDPIELGRVEGIMMDHVIRLANGQPLYVAPSFQFIPLAYMPLYPLLTAALAIGQEPQFWHGRLLALVSSVLLGMLVGWIVTRETRSRALGFAGSALFLMGFGVTQLCYDMVQPNSTMLLFAFGGLALLRYSTRTRGAVGAALLLSAAFYTKQHALCFAAAALPWLWLEDRRRLLPYALALLVGCGGTFAVLSHWLGPWFNFYVFDVPSHWSEVDRGRILFYLGHDLLGTLCVLAPAALLSTGIAERAWRGREALWLWTGLGGVATGLLATLDPYAGRHVIMPTIVSFAVLGPIALARLAEAGERIPAQRQRCLATLHAVLMIQFLPLLFAVRETLPRRDVQATRQDIVRRLGASRGVMVPFHGYLGWAARRGSSLSVLALDDVLRARGNRLLRDDPHYFERMFDSLRTAPGRPSLVMDLPLTRCGDRSMPLWASLAPAYHLAGNLGALTEELRPVAGYHGTLPTFVYVPNAPVPVVRPTVAEVARKVGGSLTTSGADRAPAEAHAARGGFAGSAVSAPLPAAETAIIR